MKEFAGRHKTIFLLLFLFFIFLGWNLIVTDFYADEVWNFGFGYAITKGEVPYQDFNMVIPPLYSFILSFFFQLFGSNMLVFHIVNSFILTGFSYLLYILISKKMFYLLLLLFIPYPATYPSYNILILFFFALILALEKKKENDYLIGFILGLSLLTKQSIGFCLLLPSFFYFREPKKIFHRFIGLIIPCSFFVLYLLYHHTFQEFMNLCVFGLIDFSSNHSSYIVYYLLGIVYLVLSIYWIRSHPKEISFYYGLSMISMMIPLFEIYHTVLAFVCLFLVILMKKEIPNFKPLFVFCSILIGVSCVHLMRLDGKITYPNSIPHFQYRMVSQEAIQYIDTVNHYIDSLDREVVILSNNSYLFRIVRDEEITYLDLINYGNHGYHGTEKLIQLVKKKEGSIVMINQSDFNSFRQTNQKVLQYVVEHGTYLESVAGFDVYVLGG